MSNDNVNVFFVFLFSKNSIKKKIKKKIKKN